MNKKIMLLALGAVSVVMLAVPAMSSALTPLHLSETPVGPKTIDSLGEARLSSTGSGLTVICNEVKGTTTFTSTTGGTLSLTFSGSCRTSLGGTCTNVEGSTSITTTTLPFHLVTVEGTTTSPGVLVTPGEGGHFSTFTCTVLGVKTEFVVKGNGVVGTITNVGCGGKSSEPTISFEISSHGVQKHKKVVGTTTEYSLEKGTEKSGQSGSGKITLGSEPTLVCT